MSKQEKDRVDSPGNLNNKRASSEQDSSANSRGQESNISGRQTDQEPSLSSRIQSSASMLFRDVVARPGGGGGHQLGTDLAQSLASSDKASTVAAGAASSSASASATQASRLRNREGPGSASFGAGASGNGTDIAGSQSAGGFRSGLSATSSESTGGFRLDDMSLEQFSQQHARPLEGDYRDDVDQNRVFFANSDLTLHEAIPAHLSQREESMGKGKGRARDVETSPIKNIQQEAHHDPLTDASMLTSRPIPPSTHQPQTLPSQPNNNDNDGAAVVSLLSDPSFQPGYLFQTDGNDQSFADELRADNPDAPLPPLTADEIRIIDSFRRHPSFSDPHQKPSITSTSLIPDIDSFLAQDQEGRTSNGIANLRDAIVANLPDGDSVTAEWLRVEERYQDEVWGYLQPELEAAAKELEERRERQHDTEDGQSTAEGPAVRRLRMILKHMQG